MCGLGDADHDGTGDFAVGAPHEDAPAAESGRVLVYRGGAARTGVLQLVGRFSAAQDRGACLRILGAPSLIGAVQAGLARSEGLMLDGARRAGARVETWRLGDPFDLAPVSGLAGDADGLLEIGPFQLPPDAVGLTFRIEGFTSVTLASGGAPGALRGTNSLTLTVMP